MTWRRTLADVYTWEGPEFALSIACAVGGIGLSVFGAAPRSIEQSVPWTLARAWGGCLAVGGLAIVLGLLLGRWVIERAGLCLLVPAAPVFTGAVFASQGWGGLLPGLTLLLVMSFGMASRFRRVRQIRASQEALRRSRAGSGYG